MYIFLSCLYINLYTTDTILEFKPFLWSLKRPDLKIKYGVLYSYKQVSEKWNPS